MMRYQDLMVKLKRKDVASVYLFSGDETYLKEEVVEKIDKILINPEYKDFNYDLLYADKADAQTIINKVASLPFLSEKRLVIVNRAEKLEEADQKRLVKFLQNPVATTCLIFVTTNRVNMKTSFYSKLADIGEAVVFWPLFDSQVSQWIKNKVKEESKVIAITEDAVSYLQEAVGNDLMKLSSQIDKLIIYSEGKNKITLNEIKEVIADIKEGNIYEMINAIGERKKTVSLKILNKLIQKGESPVKLLGSIAFRFRKFLTAKILIEKQVALRDITSRLRINTFMDKNFIKQTNNFSKQKAIENLKHILKADIELKTGKRGPRLTMELLILNLCG